MHVIGRRDVDSASSVGHFSYQQFMSKLSGIDLMKKILTLSAVAFLAAGVVAEQADASTPQPPTVNPLTSIGTFDLSAFDGATGLSYQDSAGLQSGYDITSTIGKTFDFYFGSYNDVAPASAFPSLGALSGGADSWSVSETSAMDYAVAFANSIADGSAFSQVAAFPVDVSTSFFNTVNYVFAYALEQNSPQDDSTVRVKVVSFDGLTGPNSTPGLSISDGVVSSDTPELVQFIDQPTSDQIAPIWWATLPGQGGRDPNRVPEIDGPVLVQVGFALMGLYVLMLGRRRREDDAGATPLAA